MIFIGINIIGADEYHYAYDSIITVAYQINQSLKEKRKKEPLETKTIIMGNGSKVIYSS